MLGYKYYKNKAPYSALTTVSTESSNSGKVDETDNWKTYTNTKFGYTLSYDPNSSLKQYSCSQQESGKNGDDVFVLESIDSTFPKCGFGGYVWPISIYSSDQMLDCKSSNYLTAIKTTVKVNGIDSIKCEYKFTGTPEQQAENQGVDYEVRVYVPKNGKYFIIELSDKRFLEAYNQILSTFKFN